MSLNYVIHCIFQYDVHSQRSIRLNILVSREEKLPISTSINLLNRFLFHSEEGIIADFSWGKSIRVFLPKPNCTLAIASTSPLRGSIATTAPLCSLSNSSALSCNSRSRLKKRSSPAIGDFSSSISWGFPWASTSVSSYPAFPWRRASLMSEQLLKAGLVTEEQVKKASEKPKKKHHKKNSGKQKQLVKNKKGKNKGIKEESDLEKFYKMRSSQDNKEKQEALKKKREAAQRKKEMNKKISSLISDNILNVKDADIRYNFVVGTTIKYVFVSEEQQEKLAQGELAVTFHNGQKCIISSVIGKEILKINPGKIVVINDVANDNSPS
ncbi:hypothetical protein GQR58_003322 [Nymphon striatum]|nr:hypothetical protein GQR58_003322 [Nymphon striatum]